MPALELPGATLNYRTAGDGPPLVLVHGSATDLTTWDGVIDELARDHRVIAYDRRGYGQSRHRPSATCRPTPNRYWPNGTPTPSVSCTSTFRRAP